MDELSGRLVANIAINRAAAEKGGDVIFDFLVEEGAPDKVQSFLAKLPGAEKQQAASEDGSGVGGVMGAAMRMMGAGLSIGNVQSVSQQFIANACEKVGEDEVGQFVAAIPAQFV